MKQDDREALRHLAAAHGPAVLLDALHSVVRWHAVLTELRLHCSALADSMTHAGELLRAQVDAITRDEAQLTILEEEVKALARTTPHRSK